MPLVTLPHFTAADDFYEALIDAHRELTAPQSHELNAKLVLLLANHVGDQSVLVEALAAARASVLISAQTSAPASPSDPQASVPSAARDDRLTP